MKSVSCRAAGLRRDGRQYDQADVALVEAGDGVAEVHGVPSGEAGGYAQDVLLRSG